MLEPASQMNATSVRPHRDHRRGDAGTPTISEEAILATTLDIPETACEHALQSLPNNVRNTEPTMRVPAIERAAKVLRAISDSPEPLAFGDVVQRTGLPKSTVHDLCESLAEVRFIERLPGGRLRLSWHLANLVRHQLATSDVVTLFLQECAASSPLPGETLVLSVLDGDHVLYLACRNGNKPLSVVYKLGMRLPALSTASGKAILASLPPAELEAFRVSLGETVDSQRWQQYQKEFEGVRRTGYSIDDEETAPGMFCIGAAVHSADSPAAVAAIAVCMVKGAASEAARAEAASVVTGLARDLSLSLGYGHGMVRQ